jgi:hypothetical protein
MKPHTVVISIVTASPPPIGDCCSSSLYEVSAEITPQDTRRCWPRSIRSGSSFTNCCDCRTIAGSTA